MTYTQVSAGQLIKASIANANWRHMGRADFSSFYPMDIDGNYLIQDLGETGKEWDNAKFLGVVDVATEITTPLVTADVTNSGAISTDGKEQFKLDIVSTSYSFADGANTINIAHGKGASIRGALLPFSNSTNHTTTLKYIDDEYVSFSITSAGSSSGTMYLVVIYV